MANLKISALTALAGSSVEQLADVLPIVDNSVTTTKKILISELAQAMLVLGTEQASTSGTEIDFTIPAWAKKVSVLFKGVSTNGTSSLIIRIGDAGGVEETGYLSGAGYSDVISESTTGFIITVNAVAASTYHGAITLKLENAAAFSWASSGNIYGTGSLPIYKSAGSKSLSAALTTVRITSITPDTFDAGAINVQYE